MPRVARAPNSSIFIRNVPDGALGDDLRQICEKYGTVKDVYIPLDYHTQRQRGFAYVQFEDQRDAREAADDLNGFRLMDVQLNVEMAKGNRKNPDQMMAREQHANPERHEGRNRRHEEDFNRSHRTGRHDMDYDRSQRNDRYEVNYDRGHNSGRYSVNPAYGQRTGRYEEDHWRAQRSERYEMDYGRSGKRFDGREKLYDKRPYEPRPYVEQCRYKRRSDEMEHFDQRRENYEPRSRCVEQRAVRPEPRLGGREQRQCERFGRQGTRRHDNHRNANSGRNARSDDSRFARGRRECSRFVRSDHRSKEDDSFVGLHSPTLEMSVETGQRFSSKSRATRSRSPSAKRRKFDHTDDESFIEVTSPEEETNVQRPRSPTP